MPIAPINANTIGDTAVVAAVTSPGNKKIRVKQLVIYNQVATAQSAKLRSGTTDLFTAIPLPLAIGLPVDIDAAPEPGGFLAETVAGQALNVNLTAATAVGGYVIYSLE
jgi:hypothetical protein